MKSKIFHVSTPPKELVILKGCSVGPTIPQGFYLNPFRLNHWKILISTSPDAMLEKEKEDVLSSFLNTELGETYKIN